MLRTKGFVTSLTSGGRASIGCLRPNQTSMAFVSSALLFGLVTATGSPPLRGAHRGCHSAAVCDDAPQTSAPPTPADASPPHAASISNTKRFRGITDIPHSVKLEAALRAQCADAVARFTGSNIWCTRAQARCAGFAVAPNEVPAVVTSPDLRCKSIEFFNRRQLIPVAEQLAQSLPACTSISSPELYLLCAENTEAVAAAARDDASTSVLRARRSGRYLRPMAPEVAAALLEQFPTAVAAISAGEVPAPISSRVFVTKGGMRFLGLHPVDDAAPLTVDGKGRLRANVVQLYRLVDTRDVAGGDPTSISEEELKAIPIVRKAISTRAVRSCSEGATPRFASGLPLPAIMAAHVDPAGHPREAELRAFTSTTWYTRRDFKRLNLQPKGDAVPFLVPFLPVNNNDDAPPKSATHFPIFNEAQVVSAATACIAVHAVTPTVAGAMEAHGAVGVHPRDPGSSTLHDAAVLAPAVRV